MYKDVGWSGDYTKIMTGNKACMGSFNDEVSSLRVVPAGSTALANKTFYIKNGDSGLFMDTLNVEHPTANALSQTTFAGGTNQQFTFIHHGNGVYSIASPSAKKVVSATHEDTIVQRSASRQTSSSDSIHGGQKFIALKQGRHYQFISLETQKVLVGKHGTLKQTTNHNQATSYWELLDI
ncbi:hypothetical protein TDB9533_03041 [Thalassocella blandensis]|nr:hypothetical protein TDB9533_03041 [Thalassocella blandensis]